MSDGISNFIKVGDTISMGGRVKETIRTQSSCVGDNNGTDCIFTTSKGEIKKQDQKWEQIQQNHAKKEAAIKDEMNKKHSNTISDEAAFRNRMNGVSFEKSSGEAVPAQEQNSENAKTRSDAAAFRERMKSVSFEQTPAKPVPEPPKAQETPQLTPIEITLQALDNAGSAQHEKIEAEYNSELDVAKQEFNSAIQVSREGQSLDIDVVNKFLKAQDVASVKQEQKHKFIDKMIQQDKQELLADYDKKMAQVIADNQKEAPESSTMEIDRNFEEFPAEEINVATQVFMKKINPRQINDAVHDATQNGQQLLREKTIYNELKAKQSSGAGLSQVEQSFIKSFDAKLKDLQLKIGDDGRLTNK